MNYFLNWQNIVIIFLLFSILGFIFEKIIYILTKGKKNKDKILKGPYLLSYGINLLILILIFEMLLKNYNLLNTKLYVSLFFIAGIISIILNVLYKRILNNLILIDYKGRKENLIYIFMEEGLITLILYFLYYNYFKNYLYSMDKGKIEVFAVLSILILMVDIMYKIDLLNKELKKEKNFKRPKNHWCPF